MISSGEHLQIIRKLQLPLIRHLLFWNKDQKKISSLLNCSTQAPTERKHENKMIEKISNTLAWSWNNVTGIGHFISKIILRGCDSVKVRIESNLLVQQDAYLHLSTTDYSDAPWLCNTGVGQIVPFDLAQTFLPKFHGNVGWFSIQNWLEYSREDSEGGILVWRVSLTI